MLISNKVKGCYCVNKTNIQVIKNLLGYENATKHWTSNVSNVQKLIIVTWLMTHPTQSLTVCLQILAAFVINAYWSEPSKAIILKYHILRNSTKLKVHFDWKNCNSLCNITYNIAAYCALKNTVFGMYRAMDQSKKMYDWWKLPHSNTFIIVAI